MNKKHRKPFREPDMLGEKRIMKKGKKFLENTYRALENTYRDMKKE